MISLDLHIPVSKVIDLWKHFTFEKFCLTISIRSYHSHRLKNFLHPHKNIIVTVKKLQNKFFFIGKCWTQMYLYFSKIITEVIPVLFWQILSIMYVDHNPTSFLLCPLDQDMVAFGTFLPAGTSGTDRARWHTIWQIWNPTEHAIWKIDWFYLLCLSFISMKSMLISMRSLHKFFEYICMSVSFS